MKEEMIIIDGENNVMGRLGAKTAKELLKGKEVRIVNAEKIIITGKPKNIIEKYEQRRQLRDPAKPEKSRKTPRRPDLFVKRVIRGMLPYKSKKGQEAYRRLKVFIGTPKEYEGKAVKISESKSTTSDYNYITIEELCKKLGWKG